jgi:uncharacterized membrane protein
LEESRSHLGTLHGEGTLLVQDGLRLGQVIYEIDGYVEGQVKSASGQIEAESRILDKAFRAERATIVLQTGQCIDIVVSDPRGQGTADVRVKGAFPL